MAIREINLYDPDEVFKAKCNENFANIDARILSYQDVFNYVYAFVFPVGCVIQTTNRDDDRLKTGEWEYRGYETYQKNEYSPVIYMYRYERIA